MRTLTLSRVVAVLAGLTIAGACTDSTDNSSIDPLVGPSGRILLLSPTSATISPGQTVVLNAQLLDGRGVPMSEAVTWRSHNEAVAVVSGGGEVSGKAEGHAVVIASAQGMSQTATIHVLRRASAKEPAPNMDPARWNR
jgi:hypothetical protein